MSIPYGRLNALAAALGGWEAIEAAYAAGTPLVGGGSRRTIARPFAYNTPNLLTGATVYTPTVGDILHDAWFEVITAWNGTTPFGDVGTFLNPGWGGWFSDFGSAIDFLHADGTGDIESDLRDQAVIGNGIASGLLTAALMSAVKSTTPIVTAIRALPATFVATTPVKLVVSRNGTNTGADPGSTQGAAVLYLDISTPQGA